MNKKIVFLVWMFFISSIVYSDVEESVDSILTYLKTLHRIVTVDIPVECEVIVDVYNILTERNLEDAEKDKTVALLSSQITKFKNIKGELLSYKIPKDLDFYLVLSTKSFRDNIAGNLDKMIKASELLIEYIKTENKNYLLDAEKSLREIFNFTF